MSWYYVRDGEQVGPVEDDGFERLVTAGAVQPDTLVWREGMAEWLPHSAVAGPGQPAVGLASAARETCSRCGQSFSRQDLIQYGHSWVCANCKPLFFQELREGGQPEAAFEYGGFWMRVLAKVVDGLLLGVVNAIIGFAAGLAAAASGEAAFLTMMAINLLSYVFAAAYATFFIGRFGATPGKMACGLQVVLPDGEPVSYLRPLGRHFAEYLSAWLCGVGYLMVAFDDEKRGLHDRICSTRVIKKRR